MKDHSRVRHGEAIISHGEERTHVSILMFRVKVGFSATIMLVSEPVQWRLVSINNPSTINRVSQEQVLIPPSNGRILATSKGWKRNHKSLTTMSYQQKRHAEKRLVSLKAKKMATNISSQSVAAL